MCGIDFSNDSLTGSIQSPHNVGHGRRDLRLTVVKAMAPIKRLARRRAGQVQLSLNAAPLDTVVTKSGRFGQFQ